MGSLLDQLKGGMAKPTRRSKAGGSKSKVKRKISKKSAGDYARATKAPPRTPARTRGSKTLSRGR
tara:strand:- start:3331 stop:3525 length:195 start_codon:yes stop_codon:yes gene_type:complete